ncbi:hypothetical protein [Hymenobacter sp.]|uniref:hypothetical protein n=1 Tax=Hymenobacter sp. TaxID=1898978 RepID=UPI002869F7BD|nr:hypothetical protein [Hymenobacter sp.]
MNTDHKSWPDPVRLNRSLGMKLLLLALGLAVVHHVDHVLRVDHSGWPFLPRASPFTYSLAVYPVFLVILLARDKPWVRVVGTALLFLAATLTHLTVEPLRDKFHTWAYGSNLPGHIGQHNLLGFDSKVLGVASVVLAVLMSLVLFGALLAFVRNARRGVFGSPVE